MSSETFSNVLAFVLTENGSFSQISDSEVKVQFFNKKLERKINLFKGTENVDSIVITSEAECASVAAKSATVYSDSKCIKFSFPDTNSLKEFKIHVNKEIKLAKKDSVFSARTEAASAEQYFQFYGYLSQQQNMMQDYIRTSTYQRAMLDNLSDFQDKIVLDVGAGSGILSFFALQAGAKKVYAIEASSMSVHCQTLVNDNGLADRMIVIPGKVEEVEVPELVDTVVSEPMGYMLFNERMLESFLHAKKWLKPGGKMFPSQGDLHICPFTDEALYMEQFSKANFWCQPSFHGVNLSGLRQAAVQEYFKQPVVDTFDIRICMAKSSKYTVDFQSAEESDLHHIEIPLSFTASTSGTVHGLAFWFDVAFHGSTRSVWLSTAPTEPLTHWYQVRCLLQNPIFIKQGQTLNGKVILRSNSRQSYDVDLELKLPTTGTRSINTLDLKNPFFRYTGQQPQPPPGTNYTSPSEFYWTNQDANAMIQQHQQNQQNYSGMVNGGVGDGQAPFASNLVPLANVAPVNPGSIPVAAVSQAGAHPDINLPNSIQGRTTLGSGMSANVFIPQNNITSNGNNTSHPFLLSNQYMIGDYVVPNHISLPTQGLGLNPLNAKNGSSGGGGNAGGTPSPGSTEVIYLADK